MLDSSETSCPWHRTIVRSSVCSISRARQGGGGLSGIGLTRFEPSSMAGKGFERVSHMAAAWKGKFLRQDVGSADLAPVSKEATVKRAGEIEVEKRISPLRSSR